MVPSREGDGGRGHGRGWDGVQRRPGANGRRRANRAGVDFVPGARRTARGAARADRGWR